MHSLLYRKRLRGHDVTALRPGKNIVGLTVADYPTFFVNIPQTATKVQEADFIVQDEKNQTVYKTTVKLPRTPGVMSLTIPDAATSLKLQVDQNYRWTFSIICNPKKREEDLYVKGSIRRVNLPPALAAKLAQVKERDRPSLYADAGIWYDTLATLAQLRRANPNDTELASYWAKIFRSVGLDQVAQEPLVETSR